MLTRYTEEGYEIAWEPQPGSQQFFLSAPYDEVLYEGTRGPGKTDALLMSFAQYCDRGFGAHWRGILFREQSTQLADVIAKSQQWFSRFAPEAVYIGGSGGYWRWPTGERLLMRHMRVPKDYYKYHGHEYPWIGWEELTNWPNAECYESMLTTNRSSYPGLTDSDGRILLHMLRQTRSTCNPFGVGHNWVKRKFIDPAPRFVPIHEPWTNPLTGEVRDRTRIAIHGTIWENKFLLENDPDYLGNLLAITDVNKRRAWLGGSWDITSGGMFDDLWDTDTHVLPRFGVPTHWPIFRAFDWGSARPFSVGWYTIAPDNGVLNVGTMKLRVITGDVFRIREWYGAKPGEDNTGLRLTNTQIAAGIKKREAELFPGRDVERGPADSAIYGDTSGKGKDETIAKDMAKAPNNIRFLKSKKGAGSRVNGWQKLREMLFEARTQNHEEPAFYSSVDCPEFNRLFPVLPRDESNPDDVNSDAEDHNGDEARYFVYRGKASLTTSPVTGR